jgi:exopolyphosphatase/guanosine-5'-triphosphate,3'-diphosphate pyrophosphatase
MKGLAMRSRAPAPLPAGTVSVLDLGARTFHLLVARVGEGDFVEKLVSWKIHVRLGDTAFAHRAPGAPYQIDELAWRRGLDAARDLVARAALFDAPVVAIATAAVREARNGAAFVEELRRTLRLDARVLSAQEQAHLCWLGARRAAPAGSTVTVLDLGGGSVELGVGAGARCWMTHGMPLGVLRLLDAKSDGEIQRRVRAGGAEIAGTVRAMGGSTLVFSGGTARLAGALVGERLTRRNLRALASSLSWQSADLLAARGVPSTRVDTIRPGAVAMDAWLELLGADEALVSPHGLREGAALAAARGSYS